MVDYVGNFWGEDEREFKIQDHISKLVSKGKLSRSRLWMPHEFGDVVFYFKGDKMEIKEQEFGEVLSNLRNALKISNQALIETEKYAVTLEAENTKLRPKAEFYDIVANSKDMVEMSEVAKLIGIPGLGRNKLFSILRNTKILRSNNEPYQAYVDRGYFKLIEQKVELPYGEIIINRKTIVSQKGIEYITRVIKEYGIN